MKSFTELLPEASTAEELREVMRELVQRGSRNWTYHSAAQYVAPELWKELTEYFDDETGRPRWPQMTPGVAVERESLSAIIVVFHARLASASQRDASNDAINERSFRVAGSDGAATIAAGKSEHSVRGQEVPRPPSASAASADSEPELLESHYCEICDRLTTEPRVMYRGSPMCNACATLLRGN